MLKGGLVLIWALGMNLVPTLIFNLRAELTYSIKSSQIDWAASASLEVAWKSNLWNQKLFSPDFFYIHKAIVFYFENCAGYSEKKFVYDWFEICPSYQSKKRGTEEKFFEAKAESEKWSGWGWEMLPRFLFFYWDNLDKSDVE